SFLSRQTVSFFGSLAASFEEHQPAHADHKFTRKAKESLDHYTCRSAGPFAGGWPWSWIISRVESMALRFLPSNRLRSKSGGEQPNAEEVFLRALRQPGVRPILEDHELNVSLFGPDVTPAYWPFFRKPDSQADPWPILPVWPSS